MIRYLFIAILFFSGEIRAQQAVTVIRGNITGTEKGDVIYFSKNDGGRDSAIVEAGRYNVSIPFTMPGIVYMSHKLRLGEGAVYMTPVYIDGPGVLALDIDFSKGRPINGMTISSPAMSAVYLAYLKASLKGEYMIDPNLRKKYGKSYFLAVEPDFDAYEHDIRFFQQQNLTGNVEKVIKAYPSAHLSSLLLEDNLRRLPEDDANRLFNHLSKQQRQSKTGKSISEKLHSKAFSFAAKLDEMPPVNMPSEEEIRSGKLRFTVSGQIAPLSEAAKVMFHYFTDAGGKQIEITDTASVIDGKFTYTGSTAYPNMCDLVLIRHGDSPVDLYYMRKEVLHFFLDEGNITIKGETLSVATVEGSATHEQYRELRSVQSPVLKKTGEVYQKVITTKDTEAKKIAIAQLHLTWDILDSLNADFIRKHPDSYVSWQLFKDTWESELGKNALPSKYEYLNALYNTLSPEVTGSYEASRYLKEIGMLASLKPGSIAPDFTMSNMEGKPVSLHALRGKYVLLDFWASWCGPCRKENPNVKNAYAAYKAKGLEILAVTLDKEKDAWVEAVKKDGLPWLHVGDMKGWSTAAAVLYNVKAVPSNWLIGPDGKIVAVNLTGEALQKELRALLKN